MIQRAEPRLFLSELASSPQLWDGRPTILASLYLAWLKLLKPWLALLRHVETPFGHCSKCSAKRDLCQVLFTRSFSVKLIQTMLAH
jgi:hypothetical protein